MLNAFCLEFLIPELWCGIELLDRDASPGSPVNATRAEDPVVRTLDGVRLWPQLVQLVLDLIDRRVAVGASAASPLNLPSRANRRRVNNWLVDSPLRRAVTDTRRGPP